MIQIKIKNLFHSISICIGKEKYDEKKISSSTYHILVVRPMTMAIIHDDTHIMSTHLRSRIQRIPALAIVVREYIKKKKIEFQYLFYFYSG